MVTGAEPWRRPGIAEALGAAGWRVYLTGRTVGEQTPRRVTEAGGEGIAVATDHGDDAAVARLFDRVDADDGRLDLLVNNAAAISDRLTDPAPFWEKPLALADVLDVGLRSAYVASWYAAPLLLRADRGLIAFTSSPGSVCYMHGPAYGAQKAGVDKMAADMAVDFRGTAVSTVSIWMGILLTERMRARVRGTSRRPWLAFAEHAETPAVHRTADRRALPRPESGGTVRPHRDRRRTGRSATGSPTRAAAARRRTATHSVHRGRRATSWCANPRERGPSPLCGSASAAPCGPVRAARRSGQR